MANANIKIELQARKDKLGATYYLGKLKAPALIDLSKGCVFLVFTSDSGSEEIQIGPLEENSREGRDE